MREMLAMGIVAVFAACGAHGEKAPSATHSCEGLTQLELPETKVVSAENVAAGTFTPPATLTPWLVGDPSFYKTLAGFCRVVVKATPSADSDIKIEVWLPLNTGDGTGWNGKFRGQGNGGFAGEIDYRGLAFALHEGCANAGTNTGHSGVSGATSAQDAQCAKTGADTVK